jgi:hypothetical protein
MATARTVSRSRTWLSAARSADACLMGYLLLAMAKLRVIVLDL